ncbi:MAG: FHA domain-containing protein [Deltaproteobacteria bacterium]|nr:FHA domain-containing protein [Deltaproteobacteria bacterium]
MASSDPFAAGPVPPRVLLVEVRLGAKLLATHTLERSPAVIGRSKTSDIRLEASGVSRVHARLFFDVRGIRIVDADSHHAFKVRGRRQKDSQLAEGEEVDICGYVLTCRFCDPKTAAAKALPESTHPDVVPAPPVDDWDDGEADEEAPEPGTIVRPLTQNLAQSPRPLGLDASIPEGSVMNRLVFQSSVAAQPDPGAPASAKHPLEDGEAPGDNDGDNDGDGDGDDPPPFDSRPQLLTLHEEANALLRDHPYGRVAVLVIQTINEEVASVDTILPGRATWWGGRPGPVESLWVVPTVTRFPMVTHTVVGEYSVQIPHDPDWKMFHRGRRPVDLYRSGPFVGCKAEFDDQVEISTGAFAAYVRCVRLPAPPPANGRWQDAMPTKSVWQALAASLALHLLLTLLPAATRPWNITPLGRPDYFVALLRPEPTAPEAVLSATAAKPAPRPPPPATADGQRRPGAAPLDTASLPPIVAPTKRAAGLRARVKRRPEVKPGTPEATPTPETLSTPLKSVSVADFKVSGFIAGLPTLEIDLPQRRAMGGAAAAIRSGAALPAGVVTKSLANLKTTPTGRLPDATVKAVVSAHAAEIERCYNQALFREPGLSGRIDLTWTVDKIGVATDVRAAYDEPGSPTLLSCLQRTVATFVFPPPKGGPTRVSFPFVFTDLRR